MAYRNQFLVKISGTLVEVLSNELIDFADETRQKITFVVAADGPEKQSDELLVAAWGKVAERVLEVQDGEQISLKCTAKTRWVERNDGEGTFSSTELTANYVGEEKAQELEQKERGGGRSTGTPRGKKPESARNTESAARASTGRSAQTGGTRSAKKGR